MKDRLTIRLGKTAWIVGEKKTDLRVLLIAWDYTEEETQNSKKGYGG